MTTPPVLSRARTIVEPALRDAVDALDPHLLLPTLYHLGYTDVDGNPASLGSGKGMRSALAVLGAEAVGATAADAIPGAVAVELIHNFSLIHDDIMDGDRTRRHRPTVWDAFGIPDAIIVGDALHALAFNTLLPPTHDPLMVAAGTRLAQATTAMIAGQAQDVALNQRATATLDECLAMEANKTGALLAQSVAIGATLGGGSDEQIAALEHYGQSLGLAFQAVDDLLGIWGDPEVTGKPAGHDLRERKKSMPIAVAFDQGGSIAEIVEAAYADTPDEAAIAQLTTALHDAGIDSQVAAIAENELNQAIEALTSAPLERSATDELTALARFVAERKT